VSAAQQFVEESDQQWARAGQPGGQMAPCCIVGKEPDRFGTVIPGEVPNVEVWNSDNYRKSRAVFAGETVEGLLDGWLQVAKQQASNSLSASSQSEDLTLEESARIMQDYMSELSRIRMDGQVVHDVSLLPHPKPQVTAALLAQMEATSDQQAKSNFKEGVMIPGFFQPEIGATSVGLDQIGPERKTWQEVVDREMRNLVLTLVERSYGFESEQASQ
jgi:hypothetical protein